MKGLKLLFSLAVIAMAAVTCAGFTACKRALFLHEHESEVYIFDETEHWKECDDCYNTFDRAPHEFKDGVCEICGYYENYTRGLKYAEIRDGRGDMAAYGVAGIGTATDAELRIPYFNNSLPVVYILEGAFKGCEQITSLVIPDSVTDAGFYAFQNCTNLTSVVTGNGMYQITFCVFDGCTALTDVTFGNKVRIFGEWAFRGCTALTDFYLPDSLTDMNGGALDGCTNLVYTAYDNAQYLGSESNPYMLLAQLDNKNISEINIHKGTRFLTADFSGCRYLTEIEIPEGVYSLSRSAFSNCTSLEKVTLPSTLTSISNTAFSGCKALTEITIPEKVKQIGIGAFQNCTNLTSVTFEHPDGWYTKTMLNVEETEEVTELLANASVAAKALTSTYVGVFLLRD